MHWFGLNQCMFVLNQGLFELNQGLFDSNQWLFDSNLGLFELNQGLFELNQWLFDSNQGLVELNQGLFVLNQGLLNLVLINKRCQIGIATRINLQSGKCLSGYIFFTTKTLSSVRNNKKIIALQTSPPYYRL